MNLTGEHAMPEEKDYEAALAVAQFLLHRLDARPLMHRHERLAIATYLILDAIRARQADATMRGGLSDRPFERASTNF